MNNIKKINIKPNNIKQNNNNLINIILFILILLLIFFIAKYVSKTVKEKELIESESKSYQVITPFKGDGKNFNNCPRGCSLGNCVHKNRGINDKNSHMCTFDFQCEYCNDRKTKMFYVDGNHENEKNIVPKYAENTKPSQLENLNKKINDNNNYIQKLNSAIKKMNDDN